MEQVIKGYDVYRNDEYLGFVAARNKRVRTSTIRKVIWSTHMGEWLRMDKQYTYATTIGIYIKFVPVQRLAATVSNYSLPGAR